MSDDWASPSGDPGKPTEGGSAQPGQPYGQNPPAGPPPQYGQNPPAGPPPQYGQYPPPGQGYPPPGQGFPPAPGYPGQPGSWAPRADVRPGVIPLRPLNLGDIFEGAVRTIRGNPSATLGLSFIVSLIFTLPSILLIVGLNQIDTTDDVTRQVVNMASSQGGSLLQSFGGIALTGMLTVVLADAVLGRRMSIGGAWSRVKGRLLALIGLNLLIFAIAIGAVLVVVVLVVLCALASQGVAIFVGIVLGLGLLLGGIYLWVKVSFSSAIVVLERQRPTAALKRSFTLTRGDWWRIFGISLLAYVLIAVLTSIITAPFAGAIGFSALADPQSGFSVGALIGLQLVSMVIDTLTAPFIAGVVGLLYLDQRIRKEALDVTLMAAAQQDQAG